MIQQRQATYGLELADGTVSIRNVRLANLIARATHHDSYQMRARETVLAQAIRFILSNAPVILFVAAILLAFLPRENHSLNRRLLDWMLLLGIGVSYVWGGFFHVFFPNMAASTIGWANSPFQFEIGVADIAIGIVAIISFWKSLEFKTPVVIYIALFCFGVAVGHFYQAAEAHDYAANNFGVLLLITLIQMVALPYWLWKSRNEAR